MEEAETAVERDEREAEIIAGEIPVELSDGRKVAVREIRWGESLRLGKQLRTIITEVAKKMTAGELKAVEIFKIPEDYPEDFIHVLSMVTGIEKDELVELSMPDGELLTSAFWQQNTAFFARQVGRVLSAALTADKEAALQTSIPPAPENSSQDSSDSDTKPRS